MKLIICGNGFDLNHGINTSYCHYKEYLNKNAPCVLNGYTKFPWLNEECKDDLWSDVEKTLRIDFHKIIDYYASNYYDVDGQLEFKTDFNEWTRFIYAFTGDKFFQWLSSVEVSCAKKKDKFERLFSNAVFVTFNYTDTLERVYGIEADRVLHIHGKLTKVNERNCFGNDILPSFRTIEEAESCDGPILEHDKWNCDIIRYEIQFGAPITSEAQLDELTADIKRAPLKKALSELADKSTKIIYNNLSALESFLDQYGIEEVVIMGHSLLGADDFYYSNCFVKRFRDKTWTAYWHKGKDGNHDDYNEKMRFFSNYGITAPILLEW